MKVLFIYPPLSYPESLCYALPLLVGQLLNQDIDATALDLNVAYLKYILNSDFLKKTKLKLQKMYNTKQLIPNHKILIEKFIIENPEYTDIVIKRGDELYKYLVDKTVSNEMNNLIRMALKLAYLPYYPTMIDFKNNIILEKNINYKYNYEDIIKRTLNREDNPYIEFYENLIQEKNMEQYDIVAFTIPYETCLNPVLTFSKMIKEKTGSNIVLGGTLINATINSYKNHPDLFGKYFDALLVGEGERALYKYVRNIKNNQSINTTDGIVYKENGIIISNPPAKIENIEEVQMPVYDNINFNDYQDKEIDIEFSKGCYWGKCFYCYSSIQKRYYIMNPKKAVDIIEQLIKQTGIRKFYIIDDALNVNFAIKFADELIRRKLNISYSAFFRFEKILNKDILQHLYNSGLNGIFFGLESASKRMLKLMNKGIDIKHAERILKDAHKIGIKNSVGIMFGFPTETEQDVMATVKFYKKNEKYIDKRNIFYYTLLKSSNIPYAKLNFSITNIRDVEEFANYLLYDSPTISKEKLENILKKYNMNGLEIYTRW